VGGVDWWIGFATRQRWHRLGHMWWIGHEERVARDKGGRREVGRRKDARRGASGEAEADEGGGRVIGCLHAWSGDNMTLL
jgi:hypothetical protein